MTGSDIIAFWFEEIAPSAWWTKDDAFDRLIVARFAAIHATATRCELYAWRTSAAGRLAEIIVLDQFSRNMFRNSPLAFAHDSLALALAQEAIARAADAELAPSQRNFLYMPFQHSESLRIHELAVDLFARNGDAQTLDFEMRHKRIIERFGRYPHRNALLGRESTAAEIEFLQGPDSSF